MRRPLSAIEVIRQAQYGAQYIKRQAADKALPVDLYIRRMLERERY